MTLSFEKDNILHFEFISNNFSEKDFEITTKILIFILKSH